MLVTSLTVIQKQRRSLHVESVFRGISAVQEERAILDRLEKEISLHPKMSERRFNELAGGLEPSIYDKLYAFLVSKRVKDPIECCPDSGAISLSDTIALQCDEETCIYTYNNAMWSRLHIRPADAKLIHYLWKIRLQPVPRNTKSVTELAKCLCSGSAIASGRSTINSRLKRVKLLCEGNNLPPLIIETTDRKRCFNLEL